MSDPMFVCGSYCAVFGGERKCLGFEAAFAAG